MSDSLDQSFKTLKQTIPLLLKHKIPAIPTNYALWYAYVENQNNELHEEIERALADGRPFSDIYTQELYRKHIADKEELSAWQLRQSVNEARPYHGERNPTYSQFNIRFRNGIKNG
jgi:diguanylate cyclase